MSGAIAAARSRVGGDHLQVGTNADVEDQRRAVLREEIVGIRRLLDEATAIIEARLEPIRAADRHRWDAARLEVRSRARVRLIAALQDAVDVGVDLGELGHAIGLEARQ